jgi:hypothetical protein
VERSDSQYFCEMQKQVTSTSISAIKEGGGLFWLMRAWLPLNIHEILANKKKDKLPESLYHSFVSLCQAISHVHNQNETNIKNIKRFHPTGLFQELTLLFAIWLDLALIQYDKMFLLFFWDCKLKHWPTTLKECLNALMTFEIDLFVLSRLEWLHHFVTMIIPR